MQSPKLRLGLLLDSYDVPAWAAQALQRIASGNAAEIVLVVINKATGSSEGAKAPAIYSLYDRLDKQLFGKSPDPFAVTSTRQFLANVPEMHILPETSPTGLLLKEADRQAIEEYRLDVAIKLGFSALDCSQLQLAKYGAWHYYHGDDTVMSGGPAGFWEVIEGRSEQGTALIAEGGEKYARRVLYRSYFFTYPLSPARHRSYYFWAAASFLPRQVECLQRFGEQKFWQRTDEFNRNAPLALKHYEMPTGLRALAAVGRMIAKLLQELFHRLFTLDQWFLLFSQEKGLSDGFGGFQTLIPPKDRFWADPHIVAYDSRQYLFIEELLHASGKGHLSVMEQDRTGKWKAPVKILEKSYHLSFPFIFQWDGKFYLVPEAGGNRSIDLYESVEFPYKWEFKQTLMRNVKAVDTTLVNHAGKWWLFTGMAENEAAAPNVELFLFYADRLVGGAWTPHPLNPVISDVKRARNAGAILEKDGKLFRPSQDCSRMYGYSFDLNEIEVLTESEYCERPVVRVRPDWNPKVLATHTYASQNGLTVIDAFRRVSRIG